jgi:hypothetical protein
MAALGFAFLFLALSELLMTFSPSEKTLELSELLMTFAPSKLMLELRAGLLIFVAPSKLARGAVAPSEMTRGAAATSEMTLGAAAPSELLPDVVWGCSDFLLVTALLLIFELTIESNFFPRQSFLALLETLMFSQIDSYEILMFSHMNSWTA